MSDLFLRPEGLALLLLGPALWLFVRLRDRARGRRVARTLGERVAELAESPQRRRWWVRRLAFGLAVTLVVLAALGPTIGSAADDLEWRGVDLVVCLDVSRSMLARDLIPDRLTRAQEQIRALAERTRGDRLALVLFAGEARLRVPLTSDVTSLADLADGADPAAVAVGGSDLGAALTTALDALEGGDGRPQAIVMLTDGEDLGGGGLRAAADCAARGVAVHGVGFGSTQGSTIALAQKGGAATLRDRRGIDVVTRLDEAGLTRIADATGGTFVRAGASAAPLVELYAQAVLPTAQAGHVGGPPTRKQDRFQWPLLAALLLFMLDLWLVDRTKR